MALEVTIDSFGYHLSVSPPEGRPWRSTTALTATEALEKLQELGCHQTDAMDAMDVANPGWRLEHDTEVRRRRDSELEAILREAAGEPPLDEDD